MFRRLFRRLMRSVYSETDPPGQFEPKDLPRVIFVEFEGEPAPGVVAGTFCSTPFVGCSKGARYVLKEDEE